MCGMCAGDNQELGAGLEQTIIYLYKACLLLLSSYSVLGVDDKVVEYLVVSRISNLPFREKTGDDCSAFHAPPHTE